IAPRTPAHCFWSVIEAARIALTYRTPVMLLSDGFLANGAEPWRVPSVDDLPDISVAFAGEADMDGGRFNPYQRDRRTLARPWAQGGQGAPRPPQPVPGQSGRRPPPLPAGDRAGAELGPTRLAPAGRVPRRRADLLEGPGHPVPQRRARAGHRGADL